MQEIVAQDMPATVEAQVSVEEVLAQAYTQRNAEIEADGGFVRYVDEVLDKHAKSILMLLGMSACAVCLAQRLSAVIGVTRDSILSRFKARGWRLDANAHGAHNNWGKPERIGIGG